MPGKTTIRLARLLKQRTPCSSRLRSAVRPLLARPAFSAVVVLTLALGIGLNTAIYTVLDAALIRTLPFRAPERLVRVAQIQLDHQGRNFGYSWPGLMELRERPDIFSGVAAYNDGTLPVRVGDRTEMVPTAAVTGNLLEVLGSVRCSAATSAPRRKAHRPRRWRC